VLLMDNCTSRRKNQSYPESHHWTESRLCRNTSTGSCFWFCSFTRAF
jgi:hypothetical protein